ncbi:MAG: DNA-protecting protein DprA [Intrasporangiaceae bacterium]|nr:DNA-protecting protein DprA [Intrasporangiaceae bacterium]
MSAALAGLRSVAAQVAADGTDPDELAAIVAFSAQPRSHPDALRRRDRDGHRSGPAATRVAALAGPPTATTGAVAQRLLGAWRDDGVRVTLIGDPAYPRCLAEGWPELDPPVWLAWRGQAPGHAPGVAIVGARRATSYGSGIAAWLAEAGDVRAPGSAAPHRLLAEGAAPCCSPAQLLEALGAPGGGPALLDVTASAADEVARSGATERAGAASAATTLPPAVHAALVRAWPRPVRLEDLASSAQVPVGGLLAALTRARVNGEVAEAADGIRLRRAPPDAG